MTRIIRLILIVLAMLMTSAYAIVAEAIIEVKVNCRGWTSSLYIDEQLAGVKGELWKDLTTDESFMLTHYAQGQRYSVFIAEPQDCTSCIRKKVFYWSDGFCMIRQRGGPIGGQQRPFMPMQNLYCGCNYAHEDGWEGFFAISNCLGTSENYTYWNELPLFCGAQVCN